MDYTVYDDNPARVVVTSEWGEIQTARAEAGYGSPLSGRREEPDPDGGVQR